VRYYRGYRGYHDRRAGYRRHSDGFWYPPAAFIIGGIIGSAIVSSSHQGVVYSERHHDWCENRYRSYRRSDATYQPYGGPRRHCDSPFDGR